MSTATPNISPTPDAQPGNDEWRASVTQTYRSSEVREIAKVLASLEPGATSSSKLMLAMRFEATIFTAATSLVDYRKKLAKRLKKLQKNYVPTHQAGPSASDTEQRILILRHKYGEALTFVHANAPLAVAVMREKSGSERAKHLQQHIDNARLWATQLGVLPNSSDAKAMPKLEEKDLQRLQSHLEQRLENIRSHVVKLTKPDLFLQERLEELEANHLSPQASQLLSAAMTKAFVNLGWDEFTDPQKTLHQSLDKALQPVPPPSRDPRSKTNAALAHLESLRASSQALLAYLATPDKNATDIPNHIVSKLHLRAGQGTAFLKEELPSLNITDESKNTKVSLEDVWAKVMDCPVHDDDVDDALNRSNDGSSVPEATRLRSTIIRSKVLLTPGRPCPSNLLPAFKRKGAELVRPSTDSSFLVLDFDAFVMTIYLVPLLVKIHAKVTSGPVSVWGVDGTWDTLGHIIQDRIDHASAHATQILRKCFERGTSKARADFEMEISEATALLTFLQLARTTYMPNWQDIDV
jgi:hypothetical protein